MPIRIVCPGCQKTLRAAEKLAGKSVRCPGCGAAVSIPAVTDRGSAPPPATPATPGRAAGPPGRPSAPPAPSALDWWDDFDADNPSGLVLPAAPAATSSSTETKAPDPSSPPTAAGSRSASRQTPSRFRGLAFLLVLIPLGLQILGGADDVEARLQKMIESDPAFAARYAALEEQAAFSKQDFFAACPDGRIVGAHLAHDTRIHWVYAVIAAVVLLVLVRLLFPQGAATIPQLAGALAITATAGIVSLLIFQYLAELSQAVVLRGGGIVALVFWIVKLIGFSYRAALDPDNGFLLSLFGFTMGVGLCEEFIKLIPATGLMKAGGKDWRGACVLGLASGIGFGVAEGVMYAGDSYNGIATGGIYVTRFVSCVGLHAIWTAAAAVLGAHQWRAFEASDMTDTVTAAVKAIAVPALLHGLYDTLLKRDMAAWAMVIAIVSFAWLVAVIEHARWSENPRTRESFVGA